MGFADSIGAAIKKDAPALALDQSLRQAIEKMASCRCCAMVVKSDDELVGIITEMDLMYSVANNANLDATRVSQIMTACDLITAQGGKSPCVQLDEDQKVKVALEIMTQAGTHHLLVSGPEDKAIGLVAACDLLALAIQ